ncbi:N-acylphosphatidylethanolamine synthase-like isoform X2 [Hibiscus syriacus]|uniref:N-acylphosphatidylethanolamine synthase-like isoform X2 n=1 Tax=Hibiscus syriacus TaxID=106335 RepID=UPI0019250294|nr:N-acylphosphatidylethanolamine synthase-like isoform X2 [Hibiscus syriacus]
MGRKMEWAGREKHMGGIPRKMVFLAVGAFAKAVANLLNTTSVHNVDTLLRLVRSRPPGIPLLTVSNHMSTLDDPLLWGFKGFPSVDAKLARWALAAEDICFKNSLFTYFFRLGKVCQEDAPIRRLKWGTASLIVRSHVTPIVLPMVHSGFQEVMPEKYFLNRRPPFPLYNKKIRIMIGEPLEFDIHKMMQSAISKSRDDPVLSSTETTSRRWPAISPHGLALDEAAQRCLYSTISEQIQTAMEKLRSLGKSFLK